MSALIQLSQRRRTERKSTNWDAIATLGTLAVRGTVRDFSSLGLFFEPEVSYDGAFVQGADALGELEVGDVLDVTLINQDGKPQLHTSMEVRWMGESCRHECRGLGAEFQRQLRAAA